MPKRVEVSGSKVEGGGEGGMRVRRSGRSLLPKKKKKSRVDVACSLEEAFISFFGSVIVPCWGKDGYMCMVL